MKAAPLLTQKFNKPQPAARTSLKKHHNSPPQVYPKPKPQNSVTRSLHAMSTMPALEECEDESSKVRWLLIISIYFSETRRW